MKVALGRINVRRIAVPRLPRATSGSQGRHVLAVVAVLLIASAVVRFVVGPGAAIARELASDAEVTSVEGIAEDVEIAPELVALLEEVRARSDALDRREAEIEARVEVLALVEDRVANDLARLEAAEAELRSTIAVANQAAETDIARLTSVYENMKSENAAPLFQQMEPSFAAGFLGRMRPDAAAAILAALEPELAYTISVVLAGRNADVPVERLED
ncbi:MAG: hypothetical protein AAF942_15885 [Pseudomonadota bacterium]